MPLYCTAGSIATNSMAGSSEVAQEARIGTELAATADWVVMATGSAEAVVDSSSTVTQHTIKLECKKFFSYAHFFYM